MKLAANLSLLYPGLDLETRMVRAVGDGFGAVEILFPYDLGPGELAILLRKHGLELVLINTPLGQHAQKGLACIPGHEAEFMQGLTRALGICQATGCRSIHVMAGIPDHDANYDTCRQTLLANLRWAADQAASQGVTLTLEALNRHDMPGYFYHLPAQPADIIATVAHAHVRLQLDCYHCQRDILYLDLAVRKALALVHHVQLANPVQRREPDLHAPAVRTALTTLERSGYQGWIGCGYIPQGDVRAGLSWR